MKTLNWVWKIPLMIVSIPILCILLPPPGMWGKQETWGTQYADWLEEVLSK